MEFGVGIYSPVSGEFLNDYFTGLAKKTNASLVSTHVQSNRLDMVFNGSADKIMDAIAHALPSYQVERNTIGNHEILRIGGYINGMEDQIRYYDPSGALTAEAGHTGPAPI